MTAASTKSIYRTGVKDGAPFVLMAAPFAVLYGVVAAEAGLHLSQIIGFTVLVIAGAAQFTALQLMLDDAAIGLVILAGLAVNMRMAMYSASLVPYLGAAPMWQRALIAYVNFDQSYMLSIQAYEDRPMLSVPQRVRYFLGVATLITPIWVIATVAGALLGQSIPEEYALDFIVPIMFMAMVAPALKSLAHVAAAFTAVVGALLLVDLPSGVGLLIAAFAAMLVGALVETWRENR